ncbi:MAG: glycoside hydrolase family 15 protein [Acidimicrobiales bacterium]
MRKAPERRWSKTRDEIRAAVESQGYDEGTGTFVQAFGSTALDAALLLLPSVDFVAYDDERMLRTTDAVRAQLDDGGLVRRYCSEEGLGGREGAFLACASGWPSAWPAKVGRSTPGRSSTVPSRRVTNSAQPSRGGSWRCRTRRAVSPRPGYRKQR